MKTFFIRGETVESFVARVSEAIRLRGFADIASVSHEGDEIVVRFSWMGRSTLRYELTPCEGGARADLVVQKVSALHAAFQRGFEEKFDQLLRDVGASTV